MKPWFVFQVAVIEWHCFVCSRPLASGAFARALKYIAVPDLNMSSAVPPSLDRTLFLTRPSFLFVYLHFLDGSIG